MSALFGLLKSGVTAAKSATGKECPRVPHSDVTREGNQIIIFAEG